MCLWVILRGIASSDFKIAATRLYSNAMHMLLGQEVAPINGGEVPEEIVTVVVFIVFFV